MPFVIQRVASGTSGLEEVTGGDLSFLETLHSILSSSIVVYRTRLQLCPDDAPQRAMAAGGNPFAGTRLAGKQPDTQARVRPHPRGEPARRYVEGIRIYVLPIALAHCTSHSSLPPSRHRLIDRALLRAASVDDMMCTWIRLCAAVVFDVFYAYSLRSRSFPRKTALCSQRLYTRASYIPAHTCLFVSFFVCIHHIRREGRTMICSVSPTTIFSLCQRHTRIRRRQLATMVSEHSSDSACVH